ncbi:Cj0814 family flagellar-dependent secreted protein [Campylobacter sp. MIT 12-5580]|uniref:Cj0814 family flagellar-dependent secreted protein n=1 Tax=Campylobacter sp. MIT 12-5580 TaxID=2040651 RepID=UPI001484EA90|nr:hypothetical protein [Campylobacter sp. MIT 12-5580]
MLGSVSTQFSFLTSHKEIVSKEKTSLITNISTLVQDKSKAVSQVLGYGVDKEGFFTSDFNEAAGLPKDYKIHSQTMQNLVRSKTSNFSLLPRSYTDIDIAKSVQNAYKVVSQLLEKSPDIAHQQSFSQEDLAKYFPQHYIINTKNEVTQVFSWEDATKLRNTSGFKLKNDELIAQSFNNITDELKPFNPDILHSNLAGGKDDGIFFGTTAQNYTNKDGTITKAGLLIGFLSNNSHLNLNKNEPLLVGTKSIMGKANENSQEARELSKFISTNWVFAEGIDLKKSIELLGSDLSIDEFKKEFLNLKAEVEAKWQKMEEPNHKLNKTNPLKELIEMYLQTDQTSFKTALEKLWFEKKFQLDIKA